MSIKHYPKYTVHNSTVSWTIYPPNKKKEMYLVLLHIFNQQKDSFKLVEVSPNLGDRIFSE